MDERQSPKMVELQCRIDMIQAAMAAGDTIKSIAGKFNVSNATLSKFLKTNGIRRTRIKRNRRRKRSRRICQCCGQRYVPSDPIDGTVKLTRLCEICWREKNSIDIDTNFFTFDPGISAMDAYGWIEDAIL